MAEDAGANAAMGEAIAASKTQAIIRLAAMAFVYENWMCLNLCAVKRYIQELGR
jgi:hypothetical protein